MTVCRRQLFERHGVFDETLATSEDWDLWLRFIVGGERVGLVPEPLAGFRIRPGSLSVRPTRMLADGVGVLERARDRVGGGLPCRVSTPAWRPCGQATR